MNLSASNLTEAASDEEIRADFIESPRLRFARTHQRLTDHFFSRATRLELT